VYLDEIMFTKRSITLREYSRKNTNLTIDQEEIYVGYRACIASMTEQQGMLHIRIQEKGVNAQDFIEYLKALRQRMGRKPIALFFD